LRNISVRTSVKIVDILMTDDLKQYRDVTQAYGTPAKTQDDPATKKAGT